MCGLVLSGLCVRVYGFLLLEVDKIYRGVQKSSATHAEVALFEFI